MADDCFDVYNGDSAEQLIRRALNRVPVDERALALATWKADTEARDEQRRGTVIMLSIMSFQTVGMIVLLLMIYLYH